MTRAPALRRILASPGSRPSMVNGSIRESMHVSTPSPRAASGRSPARWNSVGVRGVRREDVRERCGHGVILSHGEAPPLRWGARGRGRSSSSRIRHPSDRRSAASGPRAAPFRVPSVRYTSPGWAELEAQRLWPRVWQMAGTVDHLAEPGDWFEYQVGMALGHRAAEHRRPAAGLSERVPAPRQRCSPAVRAGAAPSCGVAITGGAGISTGDCGRFRRGAGSARSATTTSRCSRSRSMSGTRSCSSTSTRARRPLAEFLERGSRRCAVAGAGGLPLHLRRRDAAAVQLEDADRRFQRDVSRPGSASRDAADDRRRQLTAADLDRATASWNSRTACPARGCGTARRIRRSTTRSSR